MAIDPKFFRPYHLSDIAQGAIFKKGRRVFRGYGSDTTDKTENVIYIGAPALQRAVALKAFMNSYKLNLTKENDIKKEADKNSHAYTEYTSNLSFDISLDIPAHSTNEARNNIAKLEELQRLIAPLDANDIDAFYGTQNNYFSVWFKNLIHSGKKYSSYPSPSSITFDQLMQHGFMCHIDAINYEPDMEAGFFEFDDVTDRKTGAYLFPKNIKLSLTLNFGVEFREGSMVAKNIKAVGVPTGRPLYAFQSNGHYSVDDNGRFPFGLLTLTSANQTFVELVNDGVGRVDYTTTNMNVMEYRLQGGGKTSENSFLFVSLPISEDVGKDSADANSKRKRWVKFKGFIQNFNREHRVNVPLDDKDKSRTLGHPMSMDAPVTFDGLDYSMGISVPASDLAEAKRNCAKIQYLMRMFFKSADAEDLKKHGDAGIKATKHSLKFYSPSFIEAPGTTTYYANDFSTMYSNSVELYLVNLDIDIDIDMGFFEENGYLWPKSYTLGLKMSYMSDNLIKNYAITDDGTKMQKSTEFKGLEHLFPFARQTSKIKIGG